MIEDRKSTISVRVKINRRMECNKSLLRWRMWWTAGSRFRCDTHGRAMLVNKLPLCLVWKVVLVEEDLDWLSPHEVGNRR